MYFSDLNGRIGRVVQGRCDTVFKTSQLDFPCGLELVGDEIWFTDSSANSLYKFSPQQDLHRFQRHSQRRAYMVDNDCKTSSQMVYRSELQRQQTKTQQKTTKR